MKTLAMLGISLLLVLWGISMGMHLAADCPIEQVTEPTWDCTRIIGCTVCDTKVFKCYDSSTDTCYLVSSGGGILDVACMAHPIAEGNPYE